MTAARLMPRLLMMLMLATAVWLCMSPFSAYSQLFEQADAVEESEVELELDAAAAPTTDVAMPDAEASQDDAVPQDDTQALPVDPPTDAAPSVRPSSSWPSSTAATPTAPVSPDAASGETTARDEAAAPQPVDAPPTSERRPSDARSSADRGRESRDSLDPRYAVLYQRNMFLRDRNPPPRVERPTTPPPPPPPPPAVETRYVLLGVIAEDDQYRAYIEDRTEGVMLTVDTHGRIAQGTLVTIDLDSVIYESQGGRTRVLLGQNLLGRSPAGAAGATESNGAGAVSRTPSASGGTSQGGSSPAASSGAPSVLEQMRLRRQRELEEANRQ